MLINVYISQHYIKIFVQIIILLSLNRVKKVDKRMVLFIELISKTFNEVFYTHTLLYNIHVNS